MDVNNEDIYELALSIWKMEQRLDKISSNLSDLQVRGFKSTLDKMKHFLSINDIEYKDFAHQKYNEGMNIDIIAVEKEIDTVETVVKETIEPSIYCKGQLVKRAKVIIVSKDGE